MECIRNINWKLLREQKLTLLFLISEEKDALIKSRLKGVIALIDAIQDEAVDNEGTDESLVFGTENK